MIAWAVAFVLTCGIELVVITLLAPPRRHLLPIALGAQVVTHPLVWILMAVLPGSQLMRLIGVELGATLVEAAIYARFLRVPKSEAFALSAAANAASLLLVTAVGMVL